jgi:hypothetical protein
MDGMDGAGFVAYFSIAGATVLAGWFSDRRIAAGAPPTHLRKSIVVAGLLFSATVLPVSTVESRAASVALLPCVACRAYTSNRWAITQTLAGPLAAWRWTSVQ